jgi:hypothetical protein
MLINPLVNRDQDRAAELAGQGNYRAIAEAVRTSGNKEGALSLMLSIDPDFMGDDNGTTLRLFMAMAAKAERELQSSN